MNQQEHFNRSVAVLVKAFFEGELEAARCAACACGNLVAAANGYKIENYDWHDADGSRLLPMAWYDVNRFTAEQLDARYTTEEGFRQIASTGYTPEQFCAIEAAFMDNVGCEGTENFNGLMAVVDVLADIHSIDLATATAAKGLFVKAEA
jgi:hypothetical protein